MSRPTVNLAPSVLRNTKIEKDRQPVDRLYISRHGIANGVFMAEASFLPQHLTPSLVRAVEGGLAPGDQIFPPFDFSFSSSPTSSRCSIFKSMDEDKKDLFRNTT
ncbi:hypothetical protein CISG_05848 [Coccidioides immitis RMSCC 3703]|uniref:Uncharacterized protein n=2 Tax=Coccidioides immitis TaxID=5501 RepID=A0A0J8QXE5_COCIT|nr:hypothetical protein CIRG_10260 [Coccidioides immitis RMSCC 2394]KMU76705.1 hypothetical protein CISG_05848 [Coccidioides immitis RMSCC 3703]